MRGILFLFVNKMWKEIIKYKKITQVISREA